MSGRETLTRIVAGVSIEGHSERGRPVSDDGGADEWETYYFPSKDARSRPGNRLDRHPGNRHVFPPQMTVEPWQAAIE
jgi:hypothetical protein